MMTTEKPKCYLCGSTEVIDFFEEFTHDIIAQTDESNNNRDSIITAAKKMMKAAELCALITIDDSGYPSARTMDPFLPDDSMVVWLGTNLNSKKVKEIKKNSKVALYYQSPQKIGYVLIKGNAYIVDDVNKKQTYWKEEWSRFYSDEKSNYVLIKIIPNKLELLDYQNGIFGDPNTWEIPSVEFNNKSCILN